MSKARSIVFVLGGLILLGAGITVVATGIGAREKESVELQQKTDESAIEPVSLVMPRRGDAMLDLDLPGDVEAWYEAPIYAQVSGYVKMWDKDYGAVVHTGDVLATINTPKLDAQYSTVKAKYDLAIARLNIADLTAKRYKNLEGSQAVSKQQVDVQAANALMQKAEADAARYEVQQIEALENFKTIVAPFDGIVTARRVNVGDYVSEAGGPLGTKGDATELFTVADVHKLRIFVNVPQDYIEILKPGVTAELTVPQYPNKTFKAEFLTDASALDKDSRTVTTVLVMENPGNVLWPGSYAEVHFHVPAASRTLLVPENALIFQEHSEQLAVLDSNNRISLRNVEVGRNLGQDVEILSGIEPTDRVVNTPSSGLLEGEEVRVVANTQGYNDVAPEAEPDNEKAKSDSKADASPNAPKAKSEPKADAKKNASKGKSGEGF